jgi:hypothetical protein
MHPFLRFFKKSFPPARAEILKLQTLLKQLEQIEKLAQKGKLDDKALESIYGAMPRPLKLRAAGSATGRDFMHKTQQVLAELNRVIKAHKSRAGKN